MSFSVVNVVDEGQSARATETAKKQELSLGKGEERLFLSIAAGVIY